MGVARLGQVTGCHKHTRVTRTSDGGQPSDIARKEVVIENDIGWRIEAMVDYLFGKALVIDGLWALEFGNAGSNGDPQTLFFTAGIDDEAHGLFGTITPAG